MFDFLQRLPSGSGVKTNQAARLVSTESWCQTDDESNEPLWKLEPYHVLGKTKQNLNHMLAFGVGAIFNGAELTVSVSLR